jgi:toluene monooxygenase system protein E
MTDAAGTQRRLKTWSRFGALGRRPTEYEIVTHNMNHTAGALPLEMGPQVHGNRWLIEHRDSIALKASDWDAFRDPDQLTYRKYTRDQDEQETYVDGLLAEHTVTRGADATLSDRALDFLQTCFTPCRYPGHGLQMLSAYVQQLAPSSYIGNCAAFQTADQLRRVQRVAYRTRQLANAHPARGFGVRERAVWERHADWQPIREAIERLLVAYDWDEAFVGLNLVVKPVADELLLRQAAVVARALGDELDAAINDNLFVDAARSRRWTAALCRFLIAAAPGNREALKSLLARWQPRGEQMLISGARLLAAHAPGTDAAALAADARAGWRAFLGAAAMGDDA